MREAGMLRMPDGLSVGPVGKRAARGKSAHGSKVRLPNESNDRIRLAAQAMDHLPMAVAVLGSDLRLHYWNLQAANLFELPQVMMEDAPPLAEALRITGHVTPQQIERIVEFCADFISVADQPVGTGQSGRADQAGPTDWLCVSLGRQHRVAFKLHPLDGNGWVLGIEDLIPASQAGQTGDEAMVDALAGLSNRRQFDEALANMLRVGDPAGQPALPAPALLAINLDHFAAVNDSFGTAVGDALLCLVAQRLRREARPTDAVARLGGDEFVVLLANGQHAEAMAARLVALLSRPFVVHGHVIRLSASVGIAKRSAPEVTGQQLMRGASLALHQAKSGGRKTWKIFDPGTADEALAWRHLESDFRQALALSEVALAYRPQHRLGSASVAGLAALPRWLHATHRSISSDDIIRLAEAVGCLQALTEWTLTTACKDAACWSDDVYVAVNIPPLLLGRHDWLMKAALSALAGSGLPPAQLEIVFAESVATSLEEPEWNALRRLRTVGIRIGVDHFGSSPSLLGRFLSLPIDRVKLDRSLFPFQAADKAVPALVRAITSVCAGLGIEAVSEHKPAAKKSDRLAANDCTINEDVSFDQVVAADAVARLLAQYKAVSVTA